MSEADEPQVRRGLKNIAFDRSSICDIDGSRGELWYRGYSIDDLARHSNFEETAFLLINGDLPTRSQLSDFKRTLAEHRDLPPEIVDLLSKLRDAHPMEALRTAVSALGALDPDAMDHSEEALVRKSVRLVAQIPALVGAHERVRYGLAPFASRPDLDHAGNVLYLLTGNLPSEEARQLLDTDLILHAEHGSNASTFTARVVTSTRANLHAAITAAVAALSGSAHGGAAEDVMQMAEEIGDPANAADYVHAKRRNREPVTGFGHRVYRAEDPRARHMRDGVKRLSEEKGQPHWYQILEAVEQAMERYARHGVNVNVDFYSGAVYHLQGIPRDLFVPLFAIGRMPGWAGHVREQLANNILIRPITTYNGPAPREYVPIDRRELT